MQSFDLKARAKVAKYTIGRWLLAPGPWLLAPGSWPLAPGSWPLALGPWHLALGSSVGAKTNRVDPFSAQLPKIL
jgi:hypothetical protein